MGMGYPILRQTHIKFQIISCRIHECILWWVSNDTSFRIKAFNKWGLSFQWSNVMRIMKNIDRSSQYLIQHQHLPICDAPHNRSSSLLLHCTDFLFLVLASFHIRSSYIVFYGTLSSHIPVSISCALYIFRQALLKLRPYMSFPIGW